MYARLHAREVVSCYAVGSCCDCVVNQSLKVASLCKTQWSRFVFFCSLPLCVCGGYWSSDDWVMISAWFWCLCDFIGLGVKVMWKVGGEEGRGRGRKRERRRGREGGKEREREREREREGGGREREREREGRREGGREWERERERERERMGKRGMNGTGRMYTPSTYPTTHAVGFWASREAAHYL